MASMRKKHVSIDHDRLTVNTVTQETNRDESTCFYLYTIHFLIKNRGHVCCFSFDFNMISVEKFILFE